MESSDDELMWITQNTFSQESGLGFPEFDFTFLLANETEPELPLSVENKKPEQKNPCRKIALVTDEDLEKLKDNRIPENTKINTNWAVSTWKEWAETRNLTTKFYPAEKVVKLDVLELSNEELGYWLAKFVVEVRRKDEEGSFYNPNSLYQLCCGLLRYLRNNGRPELNIFEDPKYKHFQDSLDSEMKRLTSLGVGAEVKQAAPISEDEENRLWDMKLLGDQSAKTLSKTMVFLIGKNFGLRSGKEHRSLKFSQFTLVPASEKEPEKLIYVSFGEKNNPGGLRHRKVKRKRIEHYASENVPERCLVRLYKTYVKRCPTEAITKDSFYVAPRRKYSETEESKYGRLII